jgi:acetoin utilization deacetylase AcuC-like enzyme
MKIFYSEAHRAHQPPFELLDGGQRSPYMENADRMEKILTELKNTDWAELSEPAGFGLEPIRAVHDQDYLTFLATCWDEWLGMSPGVRASPETSTLLPATFALRVKPRVPEAVLGKAGYFMMDLSACIVEGTYQAALASANCALSAAQAVAEEHELTAFSLCRPPGHHAGKDFAAGYCFINNSAVAANWLSQKGKVAVLDIDYHCGNGTQDIFYERDDVLTISLHGDPNFEYPYYMGHADETGAGAGLGFHRNFPLPKGTDDEHYLSALEEALQLIRSFEPNYLVVPTGMDTFEKDPLGQFKLTRAGYGKIGIRLAALNLPTAIIMEGGYANGDL